MKGVQCYELFRGIALKNHAFSFHFIMLQFTFDVFYCSAFLLFNTLHCMALAFPLYAFIL